MSGLQEALLSLTMMFSPGGADDGCGPNAALYRLNWAANMANERLASGEPSQAFAMSPEGPALPVLLNWGGATERFTFDSPKVVGPGTGALELRQDLRSHYEYTTAELAFDRTVYNLRIRVEGLDESRHFDAPYSDKISVTGSWRHNPAPAFPFIDEDWRGAQEDRARQDLMVRLGRAAPNTVTPRQAAPFAGQRDATMTLRFDDPVDSVRIEFGSDPDLFPVMRFDKNPAPQEIRLTDVHFCVPFGSKYGQ